MTKHIIFYSGGICSWATADRVIKKYGKENVILLFADTKTEDEDLYRFIDETSKEFDVPLVKVADGRDVWEIFESSKIIGNNRMPYCSRMLKGKVSKRWIKKNYKPQNCILYLGIDWTEIHRMESPRKNWSPYTVEFPMTEEPYLTKIDMFKMLNERNIKIPRLYEMGFSHNNCGGFCVRAGQGHFINLLQKMPERYKYHEEKEEELRIKLNKNHSILKRTRKGKKESLTLKQLREEFESKKQIDMLDIGGCGCFVSD